MKIVMYLIGVAALVGVCFVLFSSDLPGEIEFRGQTLGPRERVENNSLREFDIFSFRDETNQNILLFLIETDESTTAQQLLEFYVSNFEGQGFGFEQLDNRYLGTKGDEVIYMSRAPQINSAVAYIQKAPSPFPTGIQSSSDVYSDIERLSF